MVVCSFCGCDIRLGTGLMFVRKDASILRFCSGKCERNLLKLGRKPSSQKWVTKSKK